MLIKYIILPLLMIILVGVYLYFYISRTAVFWIAKSKNKRVKIVSAFIAICLCLWSVNLFGVGALVILHVTAAALCMEIINLYVSHHKKVGSKAGLWNKLYCCGLVPIFITAIVLGYGYFNMGNVVEKNYTIHTKKVLQHKNYKIALIADLHFGTTMNEEKLKKWCNIIEEKKPDLVVLCGDIVDERTKLSQMKNAAKILENIKSTYGTYYVYGNHDKATYSSSAAFNEKQLKNELVSNKISVLEDDIYNINDEFTIIGRKDKGFSSESTRKTSEELLKNVNNKNFLLLLDHQPSELKENSKAGVDLQLSGHTHGGQIWPVGLISDILGFGQLNYGYKIIDNYQVIVTSGIAGWGYPIRTGHHSEYVIVDVKK